MPAYAPRTVTRPAPAPESVRKDTTVLQGRAARSRTSARRAPRKKLMQTRYTVQQGPVRVSPYLAASTATAAPLGRGSLQQTALGDPCAWMDNPSLALLATIRIRLGSQTAREKFARRDTGAGTTVKTGKHFHPLSTARHPAHQALTLNAGTPSFTVQIPAGNTTASPLLTDTTRCALEWTQIRPHACPPSRQADSWHALAYPIHTRALTAAPLDQELACTTTSVDP